MHQRISTASTPQTHGGTSLRVATWSFRIETDHPTSWATPVFRTRHRLRQVSKPAAPSPWERRRLYYCAILRAASARRASSAALASAYTCGVT